MIKNAQPKETLCQEHQKDLRLVCLTDKILVCDDCVLIGPHQGHKVKSNHEIKKKIESERNEVEKALKIFDNHKTQIDGILAKKEEAFVNSVRSKFDELRARLAAKEAELISKISTSFTSLKDHTSSQLKDNSSSRKALARRMDIYNYPDSPEVIEMFEDDILLLTSRIDPEIFAGSAKRLEQDCTKTLDSFSNSLLGPIIADIPKIDVPLDDFNMKVKFHLGASEREILKEREDISFLWSTLKMEQQNDCLLITTQLKEPGMIQIDQTKVKTIKVALEKKVVTEEERNCLRDVFSKFKVINRLEILCGKGIGLDQTLNDLFPILFSKPGDLKALKIEAEESGVGDDSMTALMQNILPKLTNLRDLALNLNYSSITSSSISALIARNQRLIEMLHSFELQVANRKMAYEGHTGTITDYLQGLFTAIPYVKDLSLNLRSTGPIKYSLENIRSRFLPSAKMLENFKLDLSSLGVNEHNIRGICRSLSNLKKLQLKLSAAGLTNNSIHCLEEDEILRNDKLEELELDLGDNKQITDQGLCQLFLGSLKNLKTLNLNLKSTQAGDDSIRIFANELLPTITSLNTLDLKLWGTKVTDEGLTALFESLGKITSLNKLCLNLGSTQVNGSSFVSLEAALKSLPNLKYLELRLWGTKIEDNPIMLLAWSVPAMSITELVLDLSTTQVTEQLKDALKQSILPKVDRLEKFTVN